jgi:hypothetical protein
MEDYQAMTTTQAKSLTPEEVVADYRAYKLRKASVAQEPSSSNRCSELGHPCFAYCYFARTVPASERPAISEDLAEIFDEGKEQERIIQSNLLEMGYDVKRQQQGLRWQQYNIVGHQDFAISKNGSPYVDCEFKSVNPYTFEQLKVPEDVRNHSATWVQKWYGQTVLYLLLKGTKEYWLFLKNKSRGTIKPIVFLWNDQVWQDAEALIKKAEKINELVQIKQRPGDDLKLADADVCSSCSFYTNCLPDLLYGPGAVIFTEEDVADLLPQLERRAELDPLRKEFEELDKELKQEMKMHASQGQNRIVIGDWVVEISEINKKTYEVPAHTEQRVTFFKP